MFYLSLFIYLLLVFLSLLQMIRKRGNNSKTGESSKLLLYYCAIVKYMCLFFDHLTCYLPHRVSRWPFIVLESMVPLIAWHRPNVTHTDGTCTVCRRHFERARLERKVQSGAIISNTEPLLWTLRPRPPLPPPSPLGKGPKWSLVCVLWTLSPCVAEMYREKRVH